jgi:hypothetical protein
MILFLSIRSSKEKSEFIPKGDNFIPGGELMM